MTAVEELNIQSARIFYWATRGELSRIKEFIGSRTAEERKTLVNLRTRDGYEIDATPLVMAAKNGNLQIADYLITYCGADVEGVGTALHSDRKGQGIRIENAPPLYWAVSKKHFDIVKLLIANKANVNFVTPIVGTAANAACWGGHLEILEYLVEQEADLELAAKGSESCLMLSCYRGHTKIVKYLLEQNVDVKCRENDKGKYILCVFY